MQFSNNLYKFLQISNLTHRRITFYLHFLSSTRKRYNFRLQIMETFHGYYKPTKTTEFLSNINKFFYIFGLPNFWVEDFDYSTILTKIFNLLSTFGNLAIFILVLAEYCAYFTQKNLTERQRSDLFFFMLSHTIISGFCMRVHQQKDQIRDVMYKLGIGLKEVYNDSEIEQQMIKRSKFFSAALTINCVVSVLMYTMEAVLRVIRESN